MPAPALPSTFLEIVTSAWRESGMTGEGPSSVLNQTGRKGDMVRWVLQAHEAIQSAKQQWSFDWVGGGPYTLNVGDDTYDPVDDFGITGGVKEFVRQAFASYVFPTAAGINARGFMQFLPWEKFRGLNVPVVSGSMPTVFTLKPDGDVCYWPRPSVACTAYHELYLKPERMTADADQPRIPLEYRMVIVWKAVMISCEKTKNWTRFDSAEEHYEDYLQRMARKHTPQKTIAGPLA